MVRGLLLVAGVAVGATALDLPLGGVQPVWAAACGGLKHGQIVRSARAVKSGTGTERRRFWRGHYKVMTVLAGGQFLAQPLFRRDDTSGEIDRSAFAPFPGEAAHGPAGALLCQAFVID